MPIPSTARVPPVAPSPVEVAAAIIEENGRYLIARRRGDVPLGGLWEFPGGKRRSDETLEACLRREVEEEIGATIQVGDLIDRVVHGYSHGAVDISFFRGAIVHGAPCPRGCAEVRWVAAAELMGYRFPDANAAVITRLATAT